MLVAFNFNCQKHGQFETYFNTVQYPDREFPLYTVMCPEKGCNRLADYMPSANFEPDEYWSGRDIEALNLKGVTSKNYLRRYLKTNGISQLTSDETGHHISQKTHKEKIKEYLDRPDVVRERREKISKTLDGFGVIDGVK